MAFGTKLTAVSDYLFRWLFKVLFRYDIFISYARRDGKGYALKLKEQLTSLDFSCFLDYDELPAGNSLNRTLKRAVKRSAAIIVVGTEGALKSRYVELEVGEFAGTGRAIIPIDFDGTLADAPWPVVKERDLVWVDETKDALAKNTPSPPVADAVDKLFKYTRRNVRVRGQVIATAALFLLGAAISVFVIQQQVKEANAQKREANAQRLDAEDAKAVARREQKSAEDATAIAKEQEKQAKASAIKAEQKTEEAHKQGLIAKKQTAEAEKQAAIAHARAEEAKQQQLLATERQKLAFSRELASGAKSQLPLDPELGILLASEAVSVADTAEAEGTLRQSLSASHVRVFKHIGKFPMPLLALSPDGRLVATVSDNGAVRVWRAETGEEVTKLHGYTGAIVALTFSPDGRRVAAAGGDPALGPDNVARVWDANTGQEQLVLRGHDYYLKSVAFSPDGKLLVTASADRTARVWDAGTGEVKAELPGKMGSVLSARFSPDSKLVVTVGGRDAMARAMDFKVRVWEALTGKLITTIEDQVEDAVFSPDGKYVMASDDKGVVMWDAHTGQPAARLATNSRVSGTEFSPDGKFIVVASWEGRARIWKLSERITSQEPAGEKASSEGLEDSEEITELRGHTDAVRRALFSPDGKFVVTASDDGTARVWEVSGGASLLELRGHTSGVYSAVFSPDGHSVFTAGRDGTARVWDLGKYRFAPELHEGGVVTSAFSPDGRFTVTASQNEEGAVHVWDTGTGRLIKELPGQTTAAVWSASFSPDGKLLVTTADHGTAAMWDVDTWRLRTTLTGHTGIVYKAVFSRDGRLFATTGQTSAFGEEVRVWKAETGSFLAEIDLGSMGSTGIPTVDFSPDGQFIVTSGGDKAQVWESRTGRPVAELKGDGARFEYAQFSPDGKFIAAVNSYSVRVWNALTWEPLTVLNHETFMFGMAFSPDGKLLVTAGEKTARIWETVTWRSRTDLRGHGGPVWSAAFSPDSKFVVTASGDNTARVWDASTGQNLLVLPEVEHLYGEHGLAVGPGGVLLITASGGEAAQIYACEECLPLAELRALVCGRVTRSLTPLERQYYLHTSADETKREQAPRCSSIDLRTVSDH